eukprot:jgi/Bigna1/39180/e_gw1.30.154.1
MSEEAEYSLYDAFRDADTNESGYLDPHEIDQALQKQGIFLTQVELSALLNKLDKNHDGKISYLEFLEELVPATPSRKRLPSFKLVLAWNFIDPNENGYVTKTELRGRLKETGHDLSNMVGCHFRCSCCCCCCCCCSSG